MGAGVRAAGTVGVRIGPVVGGTVGAVAGGAMTDATTVIAARSRMMSTATAIEALKSPRSGLGCGRGLISRHLPTRKFDG